MTWKNAFDVGPCSVSIDGNMAAVFSHNFGAMAKGSTQTYGIPTTGYVITVSVSASGLVSASSNIGLNTTNKLRLMVTPNAGMPSQPLRLNGIALTSANPAEINSFYYPNVTCASINDTAGGTSFFAAQNPVSPNPSDLSALGGTRSWLGLQIAAPTSVNIGVVSIAFAPEFDVPPPVVVAADESLTVTENSSANIVTPVITADGVPVAPDSLTIVTQPAHGVASASGAALLYTSATGYYGADSFTYSATVAGVVSNVGTVGITVKPLPAKRLQFEVQMTGDDEDAV